MDIIVLNILRGISGHQYWEQFELELKPRLNVIAALMQIQKDPVTKRSMGALTELPQHRPSSGTSMIFGHLPAGYITSKLLFKKFATRTSFYKAFMFWGMFGAIAPDIDLFYYYLIDVYKNSHHTYFTHFPLFWLILLLISLVRNLDLPINKGGVLFGNV